MLFQENKSELKNLTKRLKELSKEIKLLQSNSMVVVKKLEDEYDHVGHFYMQILDYFKELTLSTRS
jgi:hypothetical protein